MTGVYGCGSSPTPDNTGGFPALGEGFEIPAEFETMLKFLLGASAALEGIHSIIPGDIQDSLGGFLDGGILATSEEVQGQAPIIPIPNNCFNNFNTVLNQFPFIVDGCINTQPTDPQNLSNGDTQTFDVTFTICPYPETVAVTVVPGNPPTLTCEDAAAPPNTLSSEDYNIVGTLNYDGAGNLLDGSLFVNGEILTTFLICHFKDEPTIGQILAGIADINLLCGPPQNP